MARHLIFLDVETNGLDVRRHDAWEVAWWNLSTGERDVFLPYLSQGHAQFLAAADLDALRVSRFVDRWTDEYRADVGYGKSEAEARLSHLYDVIAGIVGVSWNDQIGRDDRAVMITAQPKFDLPFMTKLFTGMDLDAEPWFHRAIDIGSYACGVLDLDPTDPPGASTVAALVGVEPGDHTANADVTAGGRSYLMLRAIAAAMRDAGAQIDRAKFLTDGPHGAEIDSLIGRVT